MESVDIPPSDSVMARGSDESSITSTVSRPKTNAVNVVSPIKKPAKKPRLSSFDIFDIDFDSMDDIKEKYALYIDDGSVPSDPTVIVSSLLKKATKANIQKLVANNPSLFSDLKLAPSVSKETFVEKVAERFKITLQLLSGENTPMDFLKIKS